MAKTRVYELAKRLDVSAKELLRELQARGEIVRSASSTVDPRMVRTIMTESPFTWRAENLPRVRSLISRGRAQRPRLAEFRPLATAPAFWIDGKLGRTDVLLLGAQAPSRDGLAAFADTSAGEFRIVSWTQSGDAYVLAGWESLTRLSPAEASERVADAGLEGVDSAPAPVHDRVRSWPWLPTALLSLPVDGGLRPQEQRPEDAALIAQLAGVWHLLERSGESETRRWSGAGVIGVPGNSAPVHLVRLRDSEPTGDGVPSGQAREYHHRWNVRGHWRWQPYGPSRSQRRRVWIETHTKGPEELPLIGEEVVHVVRRPATEDDAAS